MAKRGKEGILPFKIIACDEPLIARGGLLLPYEMAKALKLPKVVDKVVLFCKFRLRCYELAYSQGSSCQGCPRNLGT